MTIKEIIIKVVGKVVGGKVVGKAVIFTAVAVGAIGALRGPVKCTLNICPDVPISDVQTVSNRERIYNIVEIRPTRESDKRIEIGKKIRRESDKLEIIPTRESDKRIDDIIKIKPTDNIIEFKKSFNDSIKSIKSSQQVDDIIRYIKSINDIIELKKVEDIIEFNNTNSIEVQQIVALETKVEELILRIHENSWDINQPSVKVALENLMDVLSKYSTDIHQMENKPLDLQKYLQSRDSTYPYDTLDTFLKKNGFNGEDTRGSENK